MVSHNADLAAEYSTRTVRIVDGKVVDDTDPLIDPDDVEEEEVVLDEAGEPLPKKKTIRQHSTFNIQHSTFNIFCPYMPTYFHYLCPQKISIVF